MKPDFARSAALAASVLAVVGVPLLGADEDTARYDTPATPPDYAFAVWAPIFAGLGAAAVAHARRPTTPAHRAAGWPLVGACLTNAAWSVAAQTDRFALTPYLPAVTRPAAER